VLCAGVSRRRWYGHKSRRRGRNGVVLACLRGHAESQKWVNRGPKQSREKAQNTASDPLPIVNDDVNDDALKRNAITAKGVIRRRRCFESARGWDAPCRYAALRASSVCHTPSCTGSISPMDERQLVLLASLRAKSEARRVVTWGARTTSSS
jgi:hypothetical protein